MLRKTFIIVAAIAMVFGTADIFAQGRGGGGQGGAQAGPRPQGPPPGGFRRGGPGGRRGPGGPGGRGPSEVGQVKSWETAPLAKNDAEQKILDVIADIEQNQGRGNMIVPEEDGRLLRLLVESIQAKQVVEIGTSVGHSGTWMALGLRGTGGKLTTFDIDEGRAAKAKANFERAGVDDIVTIVLGDAHENVKQLKGPIDLIFLDADKEGYIDYLDKLLPLVRPGGLITAHNMNVRQADKRFTDAITTNPELETLFLHMDGAGMAVAMKKH